MIVELYGLPGSGKTTVSIGLEKKEKVVFVRLTGKLYIIGYFIAGLITHPVLFVRGFFQALRHTPTPFRFWNWYIFRYAKYYKALRSELADSLIILDEGPLQNVISYADRRFTQKSVEHFLTKIPTNHKVLFFDLPDSVRETQLQNRSYQSWRITQGTESSWDTDMKAAHVIMQGLVENDPRYKKVTKNLSPEEIYTILTSWSE